MTDLHDELRSLAEQVAAFEDRDVAESGADIAAWYRRERLVALGLIAVDSMVQDGPGTKEMEIDENDPRLVKVREKMRDRLKALLAWAKETGRV